MASKEEIRAYNRSYYRKNREHLLEKQREKNRRFAEKRRKWLVEYKKTLHAKDAMSHILQRLPSTIKTIRRKVSRFRML